MARHVRVLMVGGDADGAVSLRAALGSGRIEIDAASTAGAALDVLRMGMHRLVILAEELPDVRGSEAIAMIRVLRPGIPIIFSAEDHDAAAAADLEIRVRRQGIVFFAARPLDYSVLAKVVRRAADVETTKQIPARRRTPSAHAGHRVA